MTTVTTTVTRDEFDVLTAKVASLEKNASKPGKPEKKAKRAPSEYNIFVGKKITELKSKFGDLSHTDAFKKAVECWKTEKAAKEAKA